MPLAPPIDAIQQPAVGIYGLPVGASAGAMVLLTAAQIRAIADLSGYVPYTGATGAVTLGTYGLTCGNITASGTIACAPNNFNAALTVGGVSDTGVFNYGSRTLNLCGTFNVTAPSVSPKVEVRSDFRFLFANGTNLASVMADLGYSRNAAGVLEINNGTPGTYRDLICRAILTQNGTSPTSIQITNTYTSSTSFGLLDIRANAAQTAYEISSFLGSAGGANLPINIGHRSSGGTFTSALSVATSGAVTCGNITSGVAGTSNGQIVVASSNSINAYITIGGSVNSFIGGQSNLLGVTWRILTDTTGSGGPGAIRVGSTGSIGFGGSAANIGTVDIAMRRASASTLGLYTTETGSTLAALTCAAITASGLIKPQQATTAGAPAYVLGAIYFDTTLNKLRIGGASAWETVTSV
jgi:hypothetical protein